MTIDTTFDFRTDANGKDPDFASPTLRRYHRLLWSKPLPSGQPFELTDTERGVYLYHHSALGEFFLSSDSVMATFSHGPIMQPIIDEIPKPDIESFRSIGHTIGAMMVFPGNQIDKKWTINQARGCNSSISDRFDLTVECIRRHYLGQRSPLTEVLDRYADYFELFGDFDRYVKFFLLDDLVGNGGAVEFFMPFDDFRPPAIPRDVATYLEYRRRSIEFIEARNQRIQRLNL